MTDAGIVLHTGTNAGIWGAVEVAFAVAVLVVSVALVVALLRKGHEETPESRLVAAVVALDGRTDGSSSSSGDGRSPRDRRGG